MEKEDYRGKVGFDSLYCPDDNIALEIFPEIEVPSLSCVPLVHKISKRLNRLSLEVMHGNC